MANFKKVLNFREGVQVDDSTFVVNGSLVGIGTSVPTTFFDVRNEANFVGVAITDVTVSRGATFTTGVKAGIVSVFSGIITSSTGVTTDIKFFGDGSGLANIPTSQWVDVDLGIGVSSVYNGGNVGISTLVPQYTLQVGDNPESVGANGVGIREGNIYVSAAVTATRFHGDGANLTDLDADEITSGIVTQARIPRLELSKIPILPVEKLEQNLEFTGVITATEFSGPVTGAITGDILSPGISTFVDLEATGTVTATASTARTLTGTPDIRVGFTSANHADLGIGLTVNRANIPGDANVGVLTVTGNSFKVGTDEFNIINSKIGIGTEQATTSKVVIADAENTRLEVFSESGFAAVNLGGNLGIGVSTVELRYNDEDLELSNYANGDVSSFLGRDQSTPNGNFRWLEADPAVEIMTLTGDGRLGLGNTNPPTNLYVTGSAAVTGVSTFDSKVDIAGDLHVQGAVRYNSISGISTAFDFNVNNIATIETLNVTTGVTLPDVIINLNNTAGVSTFFDVVFLQAPDFTAFTDFNYFTNVGVTTVRNFDVADGMTVGGITTFSSIVHFPTLPALNLNELTVTGVSTLGDVSINSSADAGISTFGGGVDFGGGVTIDGINGIVLSGVAVTVSSLDISGLNDPLIFPETQQFNTTSGISTFSDLNIIGVLTAINEIRTNSIVAEDGSVVNFTEGLVSSGIVTFDNTVNASTVRLGIDFDNHGKIGAGIANPRCVIDAGIATDSFILPPTPNTTQRNDFSVNAEGAFIFNSTNGSHEGYSGAQWYRMGHPDYAPIPSQDDNSRDALSNVPDGAIIFNTDTNHLQFWNGSNWREITDANP